MCQLDAARLQFGTVSPTHRAVPVLTGLVWVAPVCATGWFGIRR
jgi:hypothetical protein